MGNRESRTAVDNCDYLFSASFDAGCTSSPHAKDFGNPAALGTSSIPNTTTKSSSSVVSTPSPLRTSNVSPSSNTSSSQKSPSSTTIHNNPSQQRLQPQRDDSINSDESNADNSSSYDK
ncbi:unnamed protein product, partial [Anisakis simplex]|uniref:Uncharacterized protein n=1 Tax=Anisakis simplex TaxID=6269 RepID=A0A0M3KG39_ANISI